MLFLVCVTALVQTAAITCETDHDGSVGHFCLLCHMGPLPLLASASATAPDPETLIERIAPPFDSTVYCKRLLRTASSRAPPEA